MEGLKVSAISFAPRTSSFFSGWFAGIRFAQLEVQVSTSKLQHFSVPWIHWIIVGNRANYWERSRFFDVFLDWEERCRFLMIWGNLRGFCIIRLLWKPIPPGNVFPLACLEWHGLNISRFKSRSVPPLLHSWAPQIDVEIWDTKEGFHLLSKRLQCIYGFEMVQEGVVCINIYIKYTHAAYLSNS